MTDASGQERSAAPVAGLFTCALANLTTARSSIRLSISVLDDGGKNDPVNEPFECEENVMACWSTFTLAALCSFTKGESDTDDAREDITFWFPIDILESF